MAKPGTLDPQYNIYGPNTGQENAYSNDTGLVVIPVCGPPGTAPYVATAHAPIASRTTTWNATKKGNPPLVPAMGNTPSGDVFLSGGIIFAQGALNGTNAACDYAVRGEYTYIQPGQGRQAVDGGDWFPLGNAPFLLPYIAALVAQYGFFSDSSSQTSSLSNFPGGGGTGGVNGPTGTTTKGDGDLGITFTDANYQVTNPTFFYPDFFSSDLIS